ncbi:hypothetical protein RA20_09060 [Leisingera sp. ANG-Vp]|nr:hypothetical protein RA20_09060 [Leisingera sp. ANG-Vp]
MRYESFALTLDNFTRPDVVQLTAIRAAALPAVNVTGGGFDYDAVVFNQGGVYHLTRVIIVFAGFSQGGRPSASVPMALELK